jgi:DNA invertase Pin-like site-specific DNA recombinase
MDEPSLGEQLSRMRAAAAQHGWRVVHELEDVVTGSTPVTERPAGEEIYRRLRESSFDLLVVYDSDRVGRDQDAVVAKVFRADLRRAGVQVFSVHQPVEPKPREEYQPYEDDSALWLEAVSDTASSVYIRQFRRRRAFGMRNRVTEKRLMPGMPPTGYRAEKHVLPNGRVVLGKREADPVYAPIVRRIFGEYEAGSSMVAIANRLNAEGLRTPSGTLWIESSLRHMIGNPTYYGAVVYNRSRCDGGPDPCHPGRRLRRYRPEDEWLVVEDAQHPPLITKEQWQRCQEVKSARASGPRSFGESSLLSGLVRCGKCGSAMYKNSGWRGGYYGCKLYRGTLRKQCSRNTIRREEVEEEVLRYLGEVARSPKLLEALGVVRAEGAAHEALPGPEALRAQAEELDRRLEKAREAYEAGVDSLAEYRQRKDELCAARAEVERQSGAQERLRRQAEVRERVKISVTRLMEEFTRGFRDRPLRVQKALLRLLVSHVEVNDRKVKVVFRDDLAEPSDYARTIETYSAYSEQAT